MKKRHPLISFILMQPGMSRQPPNPGLPGAPKDLNEDEAFIFRRGRNAKSTTVPKNANLQDYHYATALEAVMGYLYLTHQKERLDGFWNGLLPS